MIQRIVFKISANALKLFQIEKIAKNSEYSTLNLIRQNFKFQTFIAIHRRLTLCLVQFK